MDPRQLEEMQTLSANLPASLEDEEIADLLGDQLVVYDEAGTRFLISPSPDLSTLSLEEQMRVLHGESGPDLLSLAMQETIPLTLDPGSGEMVPACNTPGRELQVDEDGCPIRGSRLRGDTLVPSTEESEQQVTLFLSPSPGQATQGGAPPDIFSSPVLSNSSSQHSQAAQTSLPLSGLDPGCKTPQFRSVLSSQQVAASAERAPAPDRCECKRHCVLGYPPSPALLWPVGLTPGLTATYIDFDCAAVKQLWDGGDLVKLEQRLAAGSGSQQQVTVCRSCVTWTEKEMLNPCEDDFEAQTIRYDHLDGITKIAEDREEFLKKYQTGKVKPCRVEIERIGENRLKSLREENLITAEEVVSCENSEIDQLVADDRCYGTPGEDDFQHQYDQESNSMKTSEASDRVDPPISKKVEQEVPDTSKKPCRVEIERIGENRLKSLKEGNRKTTEEVFSCENSEIDQLEVGDKCNGTIVEDGSQPQNDQKSNFMKTIETSNVKEDPPEQKVPDSSKKNYVMVDPPPLLRKSISNKNRKRKNELADLQIDMVPSTFSTESSKRLRESHSRLSSEMDFEPKSTPSLSDNPTEKTQKEGLKTDQEDGLAAKRARELQKLQMDLVQQAVVPTVNKRVRMSKENREYDSSENIEQESRLKSKEESKSIAELIVEARSDIIDLCASDEENNSSVLVNMRKKDLTVEVSDILKIKSSLLTRDDQASVLGYLKSQESSDEEGTEEEGSERVVKLKDMKDYLVKIKKRNQPLSVDERDLLVEIREVIEEIRPTQR